MNVLKLQKELQKSNQSLLVKINENFSLDESIDPGFVVEIKSIQLDGSYSDGSVYEVFFEIPPVLHSTCLKASKNDWLDHTSNPTLNYFQAMHPTKKLGFDTIKDSLFCMDYDDWFDPIERDILIDYRIEIIKEFLEVCQVAVDDSWKENITAYYNSKLA